MTTWRKLIAEEMAYHGDTFVAWTLTDDEADRQFYDGHGLAEGAPFTAWGEKRVYFPLVYDGAESVGSAPRDPCEEETEHLGG